MLTLIFFYAPIKIKKIMRNGQIIQFGMSEEFLKNCDAMKPAWLEVKAENDLRHNKRK